jgi:hypothetical protein
MTEEQGAKLSRELTTPEGLAGFLLLEYTDTLIFDDYFATEQDVSPHQK